MQKNNFEKQFLRFIANAHDPKKFLKQMPLKCKHQNQSRS